MSKPKYKADYDIEQLPHCCGVVEAGRLDIETFHKDSPYDSAEEYEEAFKSVDEAWKDALERIRDDGEFMPVVINFVKYKNHNRFENWEFRKLVNEQPDALIVHRWVNPNSGNIVEMYVLTNGSKV